MRLLRTRQAEGNGRCPAHIEHLDEHICVVTIDSPISVAGDKVIDLQQYRTR